MSVLWQHRPRSFDVLGLVACVIAALILGLVFAIPDPEDSRG